MKEYHKIQSIYKREVSGERKGKFILGEYSLPEFEYLKDNQWVWTEKIDGTNVRVMWDNGVLRFGGKTDQASMPIFLLEKLQSVFNAEKMREIFPNDSVCLYGEGYGARIQKGGGNYIPDGVDFILFDIRIGDFWLQREDIEDIATRLNIKIVPVIGSGTLIEAERTVRVGLHSTFGNFMAEGLVLKPKVEMFSRNRNRIVTKMKVRDF